jgi:hypothetical protein
MNHPLKEVINQTDIESPEYVELMKLFYNDIFNTPEDLIDNEDFDEMLDLPLYYIKLINSSNNIDNIKLNNYFDNVENIIYNEIKLFNYFSDEEVILHENYLKLSQMTEIKNYLNITDDCGSCLYVLEHLRDYFCMFKINQTEYLLLKSNVIENGFNFFPK